MDAKPNILYRGIVVNYDLLSEFSFTGDLVPPHSYKLDKSGRKTDEAGNEYGLYMTDNYQMVKDVYGMPRYGDNTFISDIRYGSSNSRVDIGSVGIVYKVDTTNLDVHKPFYNEVLLSGYNNGYNGDEWVCNLVPQSNYSIDSIIIGNDVLHDLEKVDDISLVKEKLETRKIHLEYFVEELSKMTDFQRRNLTRDDISLFKDIFGYNGIKYIDLDSIEIDDVSSYIRYLIAYYYKQSEHDINYNYLRYINELKRVSNKINSVYDLLEIIKLDIEKKTIQKENFIVSKKDSLENYSTSVFDKSIMMYNDIYNVLLNKKNVVENNSEKLFR